MTPLQRLQEIQRLHRERTIHLQKKREHNAAATQASIKMRDLIEETET